MTAGSPGRPPLTDAIQLEVLARLTAGDTPTEIARSFGISRTAVYNVGKRNQPDPFLNPGETRLPEPMRCTDCGGLIVIIPCRACNAGYRPDHG